MYKTLGRPPGSKMTISGRQEIGRQDVPWTLAAHRFDVLRTTIDPKMVQILTEIFKNHIKEADIYKSRPIRTTYTLNRHDNRLPGTGI